MGDSSGNLTKSFSIFFSQVTSFEALMISLASFVLSFFLAAPIGFFTHLKKMFEEPGEFDHISFCIETFPPAWRVSTTILGSFVGVPTQRSTRWCPLCGCWFGNFFSWKIYKVPERAQQSNTFGVLLLAMPHNYPGLLLPLNWAAE